MGPNLRRLFQTPYWDEGGVYFTQAQSQQHIYKMALGATFFKELRMSS